jgi:citrate lyase subunit beta/citryl-CoA lyase
MPFRLTTMSRSSARSHLYVPATDSARLEKSVSRGADSLIVDLEDGVSFADKNQARENLSKFLKTLDSPIQIWVRVNSDQKELIKDLEAAVSTNCHGIVLSKVETISDINNLQKLLSQFEEQKGLQRQLEISALIESATGIFNAREIASADRVSRLQIGEADLAAELGISGAGSEDSKMFARNMIVYASSSAGINPPVAAVSPDFKNLEDFRKSTLHFKELGYFGRSCIHPDQIAIANEVFTPSATELANARDVIDRLAAAGGGVALDANGRMIDEAFARSARRILEIGK